MIKFKTPVHHWNYFLAIEKDLENISRYIEFSEANMKTYSIELTHILISASSEVDVIMKQLCKMVSPTNQQTICIDQYKTVIQTHLNCFVDEEVSIDRYRLTFKPWDNWKGSINPDWWKGYNNVKHERNAYFEDANLKNAINAVGALLLTVSYYYKFAFSEENGEKINFRDTTQYLQPEASFLRMDTIYYNSYLIV